MDFEIRVIVALDRDPPTAHLGRWRLTAIGWPSPAMLDFDADNQICPVAEPDWADLEAFMFKMDAPYVRTQVGDQAWEVVARRRSAISLREWLVDLIDEGRRTA